MEIAVKKHCINHEETDCNATPMQNHDLNSGDVHNS